MTPRLRALAGVDSGIEPEALDSMLDAEAGIELTRPVGDLADAWDGLHDVGCDLLIVGCTGDAERALSFVAAAVKARPQLPIVVVYQGSPNGFVATAFEAGADEVLVLSDAPGREMESPAAAEVRFTLEKAVARRNGASSASAGRHSRTICVLGPKGGAGKTFVASNLGAALASQGAKVAVVDLDLQFGDVALALDLEPDRTIYDLATSGGALDAEKLEAFLGAHESGARVLMAPTRPDQAGSVTTDFLDRVYPLLRTMHDYVVIDTPPGLTPEVIATIDGASDLCMVATLDVLALKSTKIGLETLTMMGHDPGRIRVVLNRADSRVGLSLKDVEAALGRAPDVLVPSHREVVRSLNEAETLVIGGARSDVARSFMQLAGLYQSAEQPRPNGSAGGRRRLLRRG